MRQQPSRAQNLAYAATAASSGCIGLIVIFAALLLGIWLSVQFQSKAILLAVLLLSVPLALFLMVRSALGSVAKIQPQPPRTKRQPGTQEED